MSPAPIKGGVSWQQPEPFKSEAKNSRRSMRPFRKRTPAAEGVGTPEIRGIIPTSTGTMETPPDQNGVPFPLSFSQRLAFASPASRAVPIYLLCPRQQTVIRLNTDLAK